MGSTIALAARYLCILPHYASTTSDADLVNVPSYVKDEKTGGFSIHPDVFPARPAEKFILSHPWSSGALVIISTIYFIVLLCWDFPDEFSFRSHIFAPVITFFMVNGVPLGWLLLDLLPEPVVDNQKEESRLYEKVHALSGNRV